MCPQDKTEEIGWADPPSMGFQEQRASIGYVVSIMVSIGTGLAP
jgi:hypothetical protein